MIKDPKSYQDACETMLVECDGTHLEAEELQAIGGIITSAAEAVKEDLIARKQKDDEAAAAAQKRRKVRKNTVAVKRKANKKKKQDEDKLLNRIVRKDDKIGYIERKRGEYYQIRRVEKRGVSNRTRPGKARFVINWEKIYDRSQR